MATAPAGTVVVVGAGPTGLLLAGELALAGVRCLVLERRPGPRDDSRAICLHARSMEMLDLRGQAGIFADAGLAVPSFPLGPRGAKIRFGVLDSDFPYMLDIPQSQIERLLLARARDLGAEIRWSVAVTAVAQDHDGVTVTMADGSQEKAEFIVGCDGIRSFVRDAASIPFPGIHNPGSVILADLRLDGLPMDTAYGDISGNGMLLVFPFRDGSCRVVLYDFARGNVPVTDPVTLAEVTDSLRRVAGQDFGPRDLNWSGRYRSESRQAPTYRDGRILLAGDAAHAHSPAGAQGMNTGLQDAANLGWKLGAAVGGRGPGWLLDSYQAERHPVGAAVLALSGRQFRLNTARSPARRALRWAVHRLVVPLPPVQAWLARDYSGLSIDYGKDPGADHGAQHRAGPAGRSVAGARLPPGTLTLGDGRQVRLYDQFRDGRFVLLDQSAGDRPGVTAGQEPGAGADGLAARVATVRYLTCSRPGLPPAMLVRPDGYVAWASAERDPAARSAAAAAAVRRWCGG